MLQECNASFNTLKAKLTTSPVLYIYIYIYPKFKAPLQILQTRPLRKSSWSQVQDGHERVITYLLEQTTAKKNYEEALAVVHVGAVKEFTHTCMDSYSS